MAVSTVAVSSLMDRERLAPPAKWPTTIGAMSAIDQAPAERAAGGSTPQKASAPSESPRCREPWLPPPTWSTPPQSGNS